MQSILRLCYSKSPSNHQAPAVCLHGGMSSPQNLSSLQRYEFTVLYNRFLIQFLSLVSTAMLTRHTDNPIWQFCPSVCPSGCPSVCPSGCAVPVLCQNGLTYHHFLQRMIAHPIILVFPVLNIFAKFRWVLLLYRNIECRWGT